MANSNSNTKLTANKTCMMRYKTELSENHVKLTAPHLARSAVTGINIR